MSNILSHEERRVRRATIASECKAMIAAGEYRRVAFAKLAEKYQVGLSTIKAACDEHHVDLTPTAVDVVVEIEPTGRKIHPNTQRILDLLQTNTLTYREIAADVGCTKQNVQIVHKRFLAEGYDLPSREEILERKNIAKQEEMLLKDKEFIRLYKETNDFEQSAIAAGISFVRARKVRRSHNMNGTGLLIDKNLTQTYAKQKISGRWLYIVADIVNTNLGGTQLAEKWKKPVPFIFNLIAECREAGLSVPERIDGRENARRKTPPKVHVCKKCGNTFKINMKLDDGTKIRGDHKRVHCFDCNPFVPKNTTEDSQDSNLFSDNELEECDQNSDLVS